MARPRQSTHAFATHLGAVSGQCSELVHSTHVPPRQCGVEPVHAGLHIAGASGNAASVFDGDASTPEVAASGIPDDAAAVVHQPLEHC